MLSLKEKNLSFKLSYSTPSSRSITFRFPLQSLRATFLTLDFTTNYTASEPLVQKRVRNKHSNFDSSFYSPTTRGIVETRI